MRVLICLLLTFTAVAAEIPVSPEVTFGEAHRAQFWPAAASDGSGYFVAWRDERAEADTPYEQYDIPPVSWTLMGARVSGAGEVLDPTGIVLARGVRSSKTPSVIWSGRSYVTLWHQLTESSTPMHLMAVEADREGGAGTPRVLVENADGVANFDAASDGNSIVVVYARHGSRDVHAAVFGLDLTPLRDVFLGKARSTAPPQVQIATNGNGYVAVWTSTSNGVQIVDTARLSSGGEPLNPAPVELTRGASALSLASDGNDYLLLYRRASSQTMNAALLTPELVLQGGAVTDAVSDLVWTGSHYRGVAARSIDGQRWKVAELALDSLGRTIGEGATEQLTTGLSEPVVASNGTTVLTVWSDLGRTAAARLWMRISTATLPATDGPPRVLTQSANAQRDVALARGGGVDLVLWREDSGLYAKRLQIDTSAIPLGPAAGPPEVVFDGKQFVIARSTDGDHVAVRFLSPSAGLLPEFFLFNAKLFALGASDEGALLATVEGLGSIYARAFDREQFLPGARMLVIGQDLHRLPGKPELSWNGSTFLMVWPEMADHGVYFDFPKAEVFTGLRGVFLDRAGRAGGLTEYLDVYETYTNSLWDAMPGDVDPKPSLAFDGNGWMAVWHHLGEIRARRITRFGSVEEAFVIAHGTNPEIVWDGAKFVVAWKTPAPEREIRYATLPRTGPLVFSEGTPLAKSRTNERIALTVLDRGSFRAGFTRNDFDATYGAVPRAFLENFNEPAKRRATR